MKDIMEKDNFWLKFLDYKNLRDEEILVTVEALDQLINDDIPFNELVILNSTHEHYECMKELVDALQIYHSNKIEMLKMLRETLSTNVNTLE